MGPLAGLITLVLYVAAIVDVLKKTMTSGKKTLWIIVILVFPIVGAVVYFLVGRKG